MDNVAGLADFSTILELVYRYCQGLHQGNSADLRQLFHQDCVLKSPGNRRSMEEWLAAVDSRPVPASSGAPFKFRLLSVEVYGDQAMVKLECPLFDYFYIDYLGLLYEQDRWRIVNKMYTDDCKPLEQ